MTISVTQEDIDAGVVHDCERCPIGLAIGRVVKPGTRVFAGPGVIALCGSGVVNLVTPRRAFQFMEEFDLKRPVKPFEFRLKIPERFLLV